MTAIAGALTDGFVVAKRNVIKIKRVPDLLVFTTIQPIMFVLLFAYVFGGAIKPDGVNYKEYLMAGIFAQTAAFGSTITGVGLVDDLNKGIMDRFRSLPMSRAAVLIGRTTSDLINNVIVLFVMSLCGLLVGWRIHDGFIKGVGGFALLLFFAYCLSWVSAAIGLSVKTVEVAQQAGFMWVFPLTFLSNAFIPTETLPGALQPIANWNPISAVVLAVRDMWGNSALTRPSGFTGDHPLLLALAWCVLLLVVFVPLSIQRYRKAAAR